MSEIDLEGVERIDLQVNDSMSFSENMAAVQPDSHWGFINRSGEFVIEPFLNNAGQFSEGLAPAADSSSKWGFVDRNGKFVFAPRFDFARTFQNGLAEVVISHIDRKTGMRSEEILQINKAGQFVK